MRYSWFVVRCELEEFERGQRALPHIAPAAYGSRHLISPIVSGTNLCSAVSWSFFFFWFPFFFLPFSPPKRLWCKNVYNANPKGRFNSALELHELAHACQSQSETQIEEFPMSNRTLSSPSLYHSFRFLRTRIHTNVRAHMHAHTQSSTDARTSSFLSRHV